MAKKTTTKRATKTEDAPVEVWQVKDHESEPTPKGGGRAEQHALRESTTETRVDGRALKVRRPPPNERNRDWILRLVGMLQHAREAADITQERMGLAFSRGISQQVSYRLVRCWESITNHQMQAHHFLRMLIEGPGLSDEAHAQLLRAVVEPAGYELVPIFGCDAGEDGLGRELNETTAAMGELCQQYLASVDEDGEGGSLKTRTELERIAQAAAAVRRQATEVEHAVRQAMGGEE